MVAKDHYAYRQTGVGGSLLDPLGFAAVCQPDPKAGV